MKGKFLGETKGNRTNPINVSSSSLGSGDSHGGTPSGKYLGHTKGNRDLPINRTDGVSGGHGGGKHKAGGK
jgi:hypothetical protein